MRKSKRNKEIICLNKKRMFHVEIAERFKISPERVRQIIRREEIGKDCPIHNRYFWKRCPYCERKEQYKKILQSLKSKKELSSQIKRLSKQDRRKEVVIERTLLVKKLRDERKLSFPQIGKLLSRDHSTIIHLYSKKI